jgi:hypothetical protein
VNAPRFVASAFIIWSLTGNADLQALRYEAGDPRYEINQTVAVNMAGMGNEEIKIFARVGLTIAAESADTLNVIADVDSASISSDDASRSMLPRGARTVLRILNSGQAAGSTSDDDILGNLVGELFVRLPATGRVGSTVVDSIVEKDDDMAELGITSVTMIVNTRITGDTTIDGTSAWKLELAGNLEPIKKDSVMEAGSMKMVVNGTLAGTADVSKTGTLLSMNRNGSVSLQLDMSMMGTSRSLTMQQSSIMDARRLK